MIFDTHTHAYFDDLAERGPEILAAMEDRGVRYATQIGCDARSSRKALELAKAHPDRYRATLGIHPTEAQELDDGGLRSQLRSIRDMLGTDRKTVVGIGETGWDFYHLSKDPDVRAVQIARQGAAFEAQAELAREYGLPLVIHTRDSGEAILESLEKFRIVTAVIHCFSEDIGFARRALAISPDIFFGFSGILTYKSAKNLHEAARLLPLDRILVETDAPFLAPEPVRWTTNESGNVRHVLERLKTFRSEDGETVERTVFENSLRFYRMEGV